jgi:hypothetical protein
MEARRSDYVFSKRTDVCKFGCPVVIVIVDLDRGGMSVTNNIEAVVVDVLAKLQMIPEQCRIIYRDSNGYYDEAVVGLDGITIGPIGQTLITSEDEAVAKICGLAVEQVGEN